MRGIGRMAWATATSEVVANFGVLIAAVTPAVLSVRARRQRQLRHSDRPRR